jgi:thiamine kinase-like enzyme
LATQEFDRLERWWHQLLTDSWMQEYPVSVIHQDFWHENLLVDPESDGLARVLDWEHSRIGYPAVDLVPVDYLGQGGASDVFSVYKKTVESIDIRFADRLDQHRVLREFGGIRYSIIRKNSPSQSENFTTLG